MKKMNLPNKLTLMRVLLVPFFMTAILYIDEVMLRGLVAAALFGLASLTDLFDGKIARKYNLITNLGKFLDPLADKLLVFCALLCCTLRYENLSWILVWASAIVFLRELAITSVRLVVVQSGAKVDLAALKCGKVKTCTQMIAILTVLLEPTLFGALYGATGWKFLTLFTEQNVLSYLTIAALIFITIYSGIVYLRVYARYLSDDN